MLISRNKRQFFIRRENEFHRIILVHQNGRRFIVFYTNMVVVTSCENDYKVLQVFKTIIHNFHKDYNAPCLPSANPSPPPQKKTDPWLLFSFCPGFYSHPKRNRRQCLCKRLGDKQGAYRLCENDEWQIKGKGDHWDFLGCNNDPRYPHSKQQWSKARRNSIWSGPWPLLYFIICLAPWNTTWHCLYPINP